MKLATTMAVIAKRMKRAGFRRIMRLKKPVPGLIPARRSACAAWRWPKQVRTERPSGPNCNAAAFASAPQPSQTGTVGRSPCTRSRVSIDRSQQRQRNAYSINAPTSVVQRRDRDADLQVFDEPKATNGARLLGDDHVRDRAEEREVAGERRRHREHLPAERRVARSEVRHLRAHDEDERHVRDDVAADEKKGRGADPAERAGLGALTCSCTTGE